ncbi:Crp/Fnr family transcriptional regulator [Yeosuana sp. MJ-SS3]|uniref:Crp/Fnr family transcriptional regulator n=1 Tax=Gilvirhabdus luticola TaxID=3079858 RepID=A0ABU3U2U8_9FLAO|nr:Crp/Fnr family transcriptional regulator [Yeosuana sp. MJ-SS3]MDU8884723.1 Crp/Fnr family transcriptional regulator [Yeosuana sp. MJ-SS3]
MNIKPLLSYIQNFVELTKEEISFLKLNLTSRKYLKGQFVLQQGDVCKTSSFIIKGCTKMFYVDDDGQEHVFMLGIEDWWVSDIGSFINQTPSDFNIQCLEDTELIQFPFDRMEDIYLKIPKLERFFRKIVERGLAATQRRIIRNFSLNAKERYLFFKESYPSIEQRIPQYMIASYLGITKEFLSKIKSQIAQEG